MIHDAYYLRIADAAAMRATCLRAAVGAVLVKNDHIVGVGFNGAPSGFMHCTEAGCRVEDGHCVRAVHAEINAITHSTGDLDGAVVYISKTNAGSVGYAPCVHCRQALIAAGVREWINRDGRYAVWEDMAPPEPDDMDTGLHDNAIDEWFANIKEA